MEWKYVFVKLGYDEYFEVLGVRMIFIEYLEMKGNMEYYEKNKNGGDGKEFWMELWKD